MLWLMNRLNRTDRGATIVEYILVIGAASLLLVYGAYKTLGRTVTTG